MRRAWCLVREGSELSYVKRPSALQWEKSKIWSQRALSSSIIRHWDFLEESPELFLKKTFASIRRVWALLWEELSFDEKCLSSSMEEVRHLFYDKDVSSFMEGRQLFYGSPSALLWEGRELWALLWRRRWGRFEEGAELIYAKCLKKILFTLLWALWKQP